jgi:ADP-ribose pyrophosphatase YjhB (NUDIX family)
MNSRHIDHKIYDFIKQWMPMACTDAAVIRDGKILLLRRAIEPAKGMWALPGGHVQLGETVEEAAILELSEEAGIQVAVSDLQYCGVVTYIFPDRQDITTVFRVDIDKAAKVTLDYESSSHTWAKLDSLPIPMLDTTIKEVKLAFAKGVV